MSGDGSFLGLKKAAFSLRYHRAFPLGSCKKDRSLSFSGVFSVSYKNTSSTRERLHPYKSVNLHYSHRSPALDTVTLRVRALIYNFWRRHNSVYNKRVLHKKVGWGLEKQSHSWGQGNGLPGWGMPAADGHLGAWSPGRNLVNLLPAALISPDVSNRSSCCLSSLPPLSWQIWQHAQSVYPDSAP